MCRLYGNTKPFYIRDLSILRFWYLGGVGLGTNPSQIPRDNCISYLEKLDFMTIKPVFLT